MNEAKRDRYIRLLKSKSNLSWIELTAGAAVWGKSLHSKRESMVVK